MVQKGHACLDKAWELSPVGGKKRHPQSECLIQTCRIFGIEDPDLEMRLTSPAIPRIGNFPIKIIGTSRGRQDAEPKAHAPLAQKTQSAQKLKGFKSFSFVAWCLCDPASGFRSRAGFRERTNNWFSSELLVFFCCRGDYLFQRCGTLHHALHARTPQSPHSIFGCLITYFIFVDFVTGVKN